MKRLLAGIAIGLVAAVGGTATAAQLGEWTHYENDGLVCSIGKKGTSVGTSGVCVIYGGKWNGWSFQYDRDLGMKVSNHNATMFGRGVLGANR